MDRLLGEERECWVITAKPSGDRDSPLSRDLAAQSYAQTTAIFRRFSADHLSLLARVRATG